MNYNKYTFKQIVLYIINKINKQELGNVKLNKILWFSDLEKCKNEAYTITGETYIKQNYGPVVKHLPSILRELEKIDKAITIERETPDSMLLYTPVKKADTNLFKNDIKYIDETIEKLRHMKSKDISKLTHTKLWESLNIGEVMPVDVEALEYFVDNETKDSDIQWEKENNNLKNVG